MEFGIPKMPFVVQISDEERLLNARCLAAGLPPFPPSISINTCYFSTSPPPQLSLALPTPTPTPTPTPPPTRKRKRTISDRTRTLATLLPSQRRMYTCEVLEEARKYVRFLEAQVAALEYMPAVSYFGSGSGSGRFGVLEKLSRQQVLEVVVNSRFVQERLCGMGLCVYAAEEVVLMRRIVERRRAVAEEESATTVASD